jgi:protein SCO1/2
MTRSLPLGRASATGLILIAALAAALGLWFGSRMLGAPSPPTLHAAVLYPAPRALPEFTLVRSDGTKLTLADWKGHWTVAFFGFTHCPDICPTTLATFKQVWARLEPATRERVRFDFVSVDPARDTPELLGRYVGYFSPDFVASTGSDEELTRLTRALGLLYARGESSDGTYSVDHSASAVLIDPEGRQAGLFRPPFEAAPIAADLAALAEVR